MLNIETLKSFPLLALKSGDFLLQQGEKTDSLFFLYEGKVSIIKDGYEIGIRSDQGTVLGEISVLLNSEISASVQCLTDTTFFHISQPKQYLNSHPEVMWHIAQVLSLRLYNLSQYLVDVKRQYEGHDHLDMVDDVLHSLLHQQNSEIIKRHESKRDTPDY